MGRGEGRARLDGRFDEGVLVGGIITSIPTKIQSISSLSHA